MVLLAFLFLNTFYFDILLAVLNDTVWWEVVFKLATVALGFLFWEVTSPRTHQRVKSPLNWQNNVHCPALSCVEFLLPECCSMTQISQVFSTLLTHQSNFAISQVFLSLKLATVGLTLWILVFTSMLSSQTSTEVGAEGGRFIQTPLDLKGKGGMRNPR